MLPGVELNREMTGSMRTRVVKSRGWMKDRDARQDAPKEWATPMRGGGGRRWLMTARRSRVQSCQPAVRERFE